MPTIVEVEGVGEIEFPDGMSQDQIKAALDENFGPKKPQRNLGEEAVRQLGLTARYLAEGAAAIPAVVGDAANAAVNLGIRGVSRFSGANIPELGSVTEAVSGGLTRLGLPQPETGAERVVGDIGRAMSSAGGFVGSAGRLAQAAPQAMQGTLRMLTSAPATQLQAAAGAGAGGGLAREAGFGPVGQIVSSVAGGLAVPAAVGAFRTPTAQKPAKIETKAAKLVTKAAKESGLGPDDLMKEMDRLGPDATLSDLSDTLQRTARAVYSTKGAGAEIIKTGLEGRAVETSRRTVSDLKRITGKDTKFFDTVQSILKARKEQTAPLYAQADKDVVPVSEVKSLYKQVMDKATEAEGTQLGGVLKRMGNMLKSGEGFKTNVRQLHIVKGQIRDIVSRSYRSGSGNMAKDVDDMLKQLSNSKGTGILERHSTAYREANKIFSDESSVLKALESGKKVLSADADEVVDQLGKLSAAEKDAYMQGAVKSIRDKLLSGGKFNNELIRERMRNVFDSEESFKKFLDVLDREKTFAATKNQVLGGSQTFNKAEDMAEIGKEIAGNFVTGGTRNAGIGLMRRIFNRTGTIPKPLRDPVARLLVTPDGSRRAIEMMKKQGVSDENIRQALIEIRQATATGTASGIAANQ